MAKYFKENQESLEPELMKVGNDYKEDQSAKSYDMMPALNLERNDEYAGTFFKKRPVTPQKVKEKQEKITDWSNKGGRKG